MVYKSRQSAALQGRHLQYLASSCKIRILIYIAPKIGAVMARIAPEVACSAEDERILCNIVSSRTATFSEILRAKIILYSLQGMPLSYIAKTLNVSLTMVTRCRNRFIEHGSKGLSDFPRRGRPPVYIEKSERRY